MRFFLDHDVPVEVARVLRHEGYEVTELREVLSSSATRTIDDYPQNEKTRWEHLERILVLCFLRAALSETTDAVVEMQDKLITGVHNKARQRREEILRATQEARRRVVEALEEVGSLVLDESIPDAELRRDWHVATGQ